MVWRAHEADHAEDPRASLFGSPRAACLFLWGGPTVWHGGFLGNSPVAFDMDMMSWLWEMDEW